MDAVQDLLMKVKPTTIDLPKRLIGHADHIDLLDHQGLEADLRAAASALQDIKELCCSNAKVDHDLSKALLCILKNADDECQICRE